MNDSSFDESLPQDAASFHELDSCDQVQQIREGFVANWNEDSPATMRQMLKKGEFPRIDEVFQVLLEDDRRIRQERNQLLTPQDYVAAFPEYADVIGKQFELNPTVEPKTEIYIDDGNDPLSPPTGFGVPPERMDQALQRSRTIGPYKLLQCLGQGGMGTVYMAEQSVPVRRRVALKLVRSGMDSREI